MSREIRMYSITVGILQDLINNSPYYLPYNSYDVTLENLVMDLLKIPSLLFFSILVTCLLDIALTL